LGLKPSSTIGGRIQLLYPEKMKEVSIIVHDNYVEGLVEGLHESGLIETIDVSKSGRNFVDLLSQSKAPQIASKCADLEMQLNKLIEILERAKDTGPGTLRENMSDFLSPPLPPRYKIKPRGILEAQDNAQDMVFRLEPKITQIERKLEEISEELGQLAEHKKQISILGALDFRLEYLGESEYLIVKAGTTTDEDRFRKAMSKVPDSLVFVSQIEKNMFCVAVVAHIEDKETLENALKGVFSSFSLPHYTGKPSEALEQIEERTKELNNQKKSLWQELKSLRKENLKELMILREEIGIFKARGEALSKFGRTDSTTVITGWAPARHLKELENVIDGKTDGLAYLHTDGQNHSRCSPRCSHYLIIMKLIQH
jgi:vacuolar-type H+-ATPase subunit I/STV1